MAEFLEAYRGTLDHEGGYSNDPDDPGGETLYGISRVYWPKWEGWILVDQIKAAGKLGEIESNQELKALAEEFYKAEFWDRWNGDEFRYQNIADEMFDTAVNLSVTRAGEFLQEALNLANNRGKRWPDIVVDGKVGPATLRTLDRALENGRGETIFNLMNHLQAGYYIKRMRESPVMEKYLGWFNRTKTL